MRSACVEQDPVIKPTAPASESSRERAGAGAKVVSRAQKTYPRNRNAMSPSESLNMLSVGCRCHRSVPGRNAPQSGVRSREQDGYGTDRCDA